jgi:hypothetical protein
MFGICRLAAASILAIAVLVARAQAQDSSFMNMNMGCMLVAGIILSAGTSRLAISR